MGMLARLTHAVRNSVPAFLIAIALAPVESQIVPVSDEFQVNTYTPHFQTSARGVCTDAAGNFVIAWRSFQQDTSLYVGGVFAQRFNSTGAAVGSEFQVATYTAGHRSPTGVACDPDGRFVVVWDSSSGQDGNGGGVFGQRFDSSGAHAGTEFQVNTFTLGVSYDAVAAAASNGDFTVVWSRLYQDYLFPTEDWNVFGQRYASSGAPLGTEFQINTYTTDYQGSFSLGMAADADGDFIVVWHSRGQDGSGHGIFAQRFASGGARLGGEFQVNTHTLLDQGYALGLGIASDLAGNFLVAWRSDGQDGSGDGVFAQRYDSSGTSVGAEFQVNTYTTAYQGLNGIAVAATQAGGFVVAWASYPQDGNFSGVFAQAIDSAGGFVGNEFQVNVHTLGGQNPPAIATQNGGDFVVAWTSGNHHDGDTSGVFARRFHELSPGDTPTPTLTTTSTPTVTPTATQTPIGVCPLIVDGGCTTGFSKAALLVRDDLAGNKKLVAKMLKGPALAQTALGNPLSGGGTAYSLCVYDDAGNLAGGVAASVVVDRAGETCGALPCWIAVGGNPPDGKGYKYKDTTLAADGVFKLLYKGGAAGQSKVIVKGKGPNLPGGIAAALQATTFATLQVRASDGICVSGALDDVKKQQTSFFKAKFSSP